MSGNTPEGQSEIGRALVAIGTNLPFEGCAGGALVDAGLARLGELGLEVIAVSRTRITEAWPDPADPPYTNAAALLHAPGWTAQAVLGALLTTERAFGRERSRANAPRTLDLDLLDLDGQVLDAPGLTLPHPRMHLRRFVLEPVAEIAPGWVHPVLGETAAALLRRLSDAPQTGE